MCKRKTAQFCWKCRCPLCNEAPLKGVDRNGTKYPKHFSVKVPVLKGDGSLRRDGEGKPVFKPLFATAGVKTTTQGVEATTTQEEAKAESV